MEGKFWLRAFGRDRVHYRPCLQTGRDRVQLAVILYYTDFVLEQVGLLLKIGYSQRCPGRRRAHNFDDLAIRFTP